MFRPSIALALVLLLAAAGCRGRATHPMLRTVRSTPASAPAAERAPSMGRATGLHARLLLFTGLADVETPLRMLRPHGTGAGEVPRLVLLPHVERAVLQRYGRGGPNGPVRSAAAFGFSAVFPGSPRETADLFEDPAAEKHAIWADRFDLVGLEFGTATESRRRYFVEMLQRGSAPATWDFTFGMLTERWDLPDGSVIMRHDVLPEPRPVHVPLYRGATLIEPHAEGSLVTEFLVMGTDIAVPFFLRSVLRNGTVQLFAYRAERLWNRAREKR